VVIARAFIKTAQKDFGYTELHRFTPLRIRFGAQDANAGVLSQSALSELTSSLQAVLKHISFAAWPQDHAVVAFKNAYYQAAFPRLGFRLVEDAAAPQIIVGGKRRNAVAREWTVEDSNREGPFALSRFDLSNREVLFPIGMIVSAFLFSRRCQPLFICAVGVSGQAQV